MDQMMTSKVSLCHSLLIGGTSVSKYRYWNNSSGLEHTIDLSVESVSQTTSIMNCTRETWTMFLDPIFKENLFWFLTAPCITVCVSFMSFNSVILDYDYWTMFFAITTLGITQRIQVYAIIYIGSPLTVPHHITMPFDGFYKKFSSRCQNSL